MRVLVSGSTGLIGRHLADALRREGATVVPLVRNKAAADAVCWSAMGELDPAQVSGFDAVVHLAGEPVGSGRWTAEKKARIYDSRVQGTRRLATALAQADHPPKVILCASGINFYGDSGDKILDELQPRGQGFLADVCEAWEGATEPLAEASRVVRMRIGVVLARDGGTLPLMLPLFRLGLGGHLGGGSPFLSWITIDDLVSAMLHALASDRVQGAMNFVAPRPVTNLEFTQALGAVLHRPAVLPVPAWALRLAMGQLAEETVLSSVRAVPRRLLESGFVFGNPEIRPALEHVLSEGAEHA